jgi:hypothetical protein
MSETSTEEHEETGGDTPSLATVADKVDKLADTVAGLVDRLHGKAASHEADKLDRPTRTVEGTREHAANVAEEVRSELAKLRQQEAAETKAKETSARLAKVEKAVEKPPREWKRRHRFMGWVTDDDK